MAQAVLEASTADYTGRIHFAQRADGQWFRRFQYRDPRFGYKWKPWAKTSEPYSASGIFSTQLQTVRLPKD